MASAGTIDFKIDTAAFVAKLRQDFNLSQAIANPKNIVQVTGLAGGSSPPPQRRGRPVIVAKNYQSACWAAEHSGIEGKRFDFVSTGGSDGYTALVGMRLTMEDCIFAPGYSNGRFWNVIEAELRIRMPDMPNGKIVDFEDDR
jgi:hypothetical protein